MDVAEYDIERVLSEVESADLPAETGTRLLSGKIAASSFPILD